MNFKNAWNCKECPRSHGPDGCPAWMVLDHANFQTGEVKKSHSCLLPLLPQMNLEVIKASNRAAAVLESWRYAHIERLDALLNIAQMPGITPEMLRDFLEARTVPDLPVITLGPAQDLEEEEVDENGS